MKDNANVKEKLGEIFNKLYELEMEEIDKVTTKRLDTARLIEINKCLYYVAERLAKLKKENT